jgi:hypothetical protein
MMLSQQFKLVVTWRRWFRSSKRLTKHSTFRPRRSEAPTILYLAALTA